MRARGRGLRVLAALLLAACAAAAAAATAPSGPPSAGAAYPPGECVPDCSLYSPVIALDLPGGQQECATSTPCGALVYAGR